MFVSSEITFKALIYKFRIEFMWKNNKIDVSN